MHVCLSNPQHLSLFLQLRNAFRTTTHPLRLLQDSFPFFWVLCSLLVVYIWCFFPMSQLAESNVLMISLWSISITWYLFCKRPPIILLSSDHASHWLSTAIHLNEILNPEDMCLYVCTITFLTQWLGVTWTNTKFHLVLISWRFLNR